MRYFCCDDRRRSAVEAHGVLNGIDFLEVLDDPALPLNQRQRTLFVHFLKPLTGQTLTTANVRIEGGDRIRHIAVTAVTVGAGAEANLLTVKVNEAGDFSTYTLRIVQDADHPQPPSWLDPILSAVDFSFKVACPTDFDCKSEAICPPQRQSAPEINYLAKDYGSFRQIMLDRLAVLMPQWHERNPADLGIALVELLAYVGDYLSYQQDAVATEAYLGTARRRTSVRRHARLVDYFMHNGSNARVWVHVEVNAPSVTLDRGTKLLTRVAGQAVGMATDSQEYRKALAAGTEVFETMRAATLRSIHNALPFYTWGARECCLPKGATRATLHGRFPDLKEGDILILAEVRGPHTGTPEDADPSRRHPVRLTSVTQDQDPLGGRFSDPPSDDPVPITSIEWHHEDALPFPLCISAREGTNYYDDVSVALGNIVLADHGLTVSDESLGQMPFPTLFRAGPSRRLCVTREPDPVIPRFRPILKERPLTYAATLDEKHPPSSAAATMRWRPADALAQISLTGRRDGSTEPWSRSRDLLASDPDAPEFVVELEEDGSATLRFGDGRFGKRPAFGMVFAATYRVGNGVRGNVGADAIANLVKDDPSIAKVRNPLPAHGGAEPESIEEVRQNAPAAFRRQERAVTAEDYAEIAARHLGVQRAAATFRWTGSWRTVFATVDRLGGAEVDPVFKADMRQFLERFRMAGHDVEVDGPRYVPLEIEMRVCVKPEHLRGDIQRALLEVFSRRTLPDGRRGVFHPDNFTFGQPVFLSPLYAAAQAVDGVAWAEVTTFQRQGQPSRAALDAGRMDLGRLEIARLDNDPDFPDRGVLRLSVEGGR